MADEPVQAAATEEEAASPDAEDSATNSETAEESEKVEAGTLSDAELNLLDKLEDMSEEDRLNKLETMDSSGRAKEADKMREILGLEKPILEIGEDKLQELLDRELERRGLTSDVLDEMSKNRQNSVRSEAISKLGLDPSEVNKDEAFLKAYHSPELKGKSVEDRTELAIARAYVGRRVDPNKENNAKNMAASSAGDHKHKAQSFKDLSASEQGALLRTMSNDDLAKMFN